jgi:hypothetical protein
MLRLRKFKNMTAVDLIRLNLSPMMMRSQSQPSFSRCAMQTRGRPALGIGASGRLPRTSKFMGLISYS